MLNNNMIIEDDFSVFLSAKMQEEMLQDNSDLNCCSFASGHSAENIVNFISGLISLCDVESKIQDKLGENVDFNKYEISFVIDKVNILFSNKNSLGKINISFGNNLHFNLVYSVLKKFHEMVSYKNTISETIIDQVTITAYVEFFKVSLNTLYQSCSVKVIKNTNY